MQDRFAYIVDSGGNARKTTGIFLRTLGVLPRFFDDGTALVARLNDMKPGCVLIDVDLPVGDMLELVETLATRRAQLPVVVVSTHGDIATVVRAMQLGACDFLAHPVDGTLLAATLARVFERLDNDALAFERQQRALARFNALTEREQDVLHGLVAGAHNKTLAHALGLSIRTIEMHRANLMARLGVHNLAQVLRLAFDAGVDFETERLARPAPPAEIGDRIVNRCA